MQSIDALEKPRSLPYASQWNPHLSSLTFRKPEANHSKSTVSYIHLNPTTWAAIPTSKSSLWLYCGTLPQILEGPRAGKSLESHNLSTFLMREQLDSNPHSKNQLIFQILVVWHVVNQYSWIRRTFEEAFSLHTVLFNEGGTRDWALGSLSPRKIS